VAAFDPADRAKDAMTVIDCDPSSSDYGTVVSWSDLSTVTALAVYVAGRAWQGFAIQCVAAMR
jgi:hypothetical protein